MFSSSLSDLIKYSESELRGRRSRGRASNPLEVCRLLLLGAERGHFYHLLRQRFLDPIDICKLGRGQPLVAT
ncbi:hypothetical protein L1987_35946 [Smallanthus sonchifolius]|uniref:Uncharacterized protein n=1 Tax=Smallanthus sonchifolius TaxID=185202 RepID=A0ACB9HBU9_9ASTR|nr:hypothetical protein L1987_35946 [Smallanthus sonchifolius]